MFAIISSWSRKLVVVCIFLSALLSAQSNGITPAEASQHIGEFALVCGRVASTKFAWQSKGTPTFINLDKPYPEQIFTAVIWREDRAKFGQPENALQGKRICVAGEVRSYRGTPEIILRDAEQLRMQNQ